MSDPFSDFANAIGSAVSGAVGALGDALKDPGAALQAIQNGALSLTTDDLVTFTQKLPGLNFFSPTLRDFVDGPLRDFAKSDAGKFFLQANATADFYLLAPIVGPQLASIAFAEPSFFTGDELGQSFAKETINRFQQAAKYLSANSIDVPDVDTSWAQIPPELQQQIASLTDTMTSQLDTANQYVEQFGAPDLEQLTVEEVSKRLGIREDVAALALAKAKGTLAALEELQNDVFDPSTGELLPSGTSAQASAILAKLKVPVRAGAVTSSTSSAAGAAGAAGVDSRALFTITPTAPPSQPSTGANAAFAGAAAAAATQVVGTSAPESSGGHGLEIAGAAVGVAAGLGLAYYWKTRRRRR